MSRTQPRLRRAMRGRAAGQKFVVMNSSPAAAGMSERRWPRAPVDDFSVALWAFAELALAHNGMRFADIYYDLRGSSHQMASVEFYSTDRNLDLYRKISENGVLPRNVLWEESAKVYSVRSNGDLARAVDGRTYFAVDAPHKIVGNILTWKFSKEALAPPKIPRGPRRRS